MTLTHHGERSVSACFRVVAPFLRAIHPRTICAEYSRNLRTSNPAEMVPAARLRIFTGFLWKPVFEYAQITGPLAETATPKPVICAEYARNMRTLGGA